MTLDDERHKPLDQVGSDPDYRFTLANERTFLAWIRTSLALMAAGVGVVQLLPSLGIAGARHVLGIVLIGLGGTVAALSYSHWERTERAMRLGRSLPRSPVTRVLASALAVVALAAFALIIVEWTK